MALQNLNRPIANHMPPNTGDGSEFGDKWDDVLAKLNTMLGELYSGVGGGAAGIVAGTTRTQAGATPLTSTINRIDTSTAVAAGSIVGDGVALGSSAKPERTYIINNTANPIQVYSLNGSGDTINGVAAAIGVSLPPGDVGEFVTAAAGVWNFEAGVGSFGSLPIDISAENVSAVSPASQATATPLPAVINHVTTVNAAGAAVALISAKYGLSQAVENATANPITVYPVNGGTDTINGLAANAPILIPGFTTVLFRAASNGTWQSDPFFNGVGALPSTVGSQLGSAVTGVARPGGNANLQVSAAGLGNGADTTDDVLFTYALPASAFDVAGRQVTITASGKFAATANNKRIKIWWGTTTQTVGAAVAGGTLIADSGVVTTNAGGWTASAQVQKYGAAGSNTQLADDAQVVAGASHTGTLPPVLLTAAENAIINITVTGASPTTGAANDVLGQKFDVAFNN